MIIYKKIEDDQLFLYMNGALIYKRWLKTGQSMVFDIRAYDKYTLASYRDKKDESTGMVLVRARVIMKSTAEGGRQHGFATGYRPNHVFEYHPDTGLPLSTFIGDIVFDDQPTIDPGETKEVIVRFAFGMPIEKYINVGQQWWIHEGPRAMGVAEILECLGVQSLEGPKPT